MVVAEVGLMSKLSVATVVNKPCLRFKGQTKNINRPVSHARRNVKQAIWRNTEAKMTFFAYQVNFFV